MTLPDDAAKSVAARRAVPLAAACLALAVLAAYHRSFAGVFVFDDAESIKTNQAIRHLWPIGPVLHPPPTAGVGGRPLLNLSFALNYAISGLRPWSYHALNLAVHLLGSLTLFGVLRRTLLRQGGKFRDDALPLAFLAALIWALQPVQTAAVMYVSERAESLMALFYLLTFYCFIRWVEAEPPEKPGAAGQVGTKGRGARAGWAVPAVLSCLLALLTKEVAVTAPVMVLIYDRVFVAAGWREIWRRRGVFYAALAGTWLVLPGLMHGLRGRGAGFGLGYTWWNYAMTECWVVMHYLLLAIWPHPLVFDYGINPVRGPLAPWMVLLCLAVILALTAVWRWPRPGFAGLWFFALLAPTSSIVPVALNPMALNRLYLPLAGVVVLVVLGCQRGLPGRRWWIMPTVLAVLCALLTDHRVADYHSETGLWRDSVAKCPDNARAHNNLGQLLLATPDELPAAAVELQAALRLDPNYPEAHNNLGTAFLRMSYRWPDAITEYETALRLNPAYAKAHYNLGLALLNLPERRAEAVAHFQTALRLQPDLQPAREMLRQLNAPP